MNNKNTSFSICIPIYNCNVVRLVTDLYNQAQQTGCLYEILLIDDCSSEHVIENRTLQSLPNISYSELNENIGRAQIRNLLAKKARYSYLIFMDCDTAVSNASYIQNYLNEIPADVVVGGYQYVDFSQIEQKYLLRWKYGKEREEKRNASKRNQQPYKSFSTFNFMIRKELIEKIQFDATIFGYGHEDTLFGWALKKQGVLVKHIDNQLIHKQLDKTSDYIKKTENAIRNLWKIYQTIPEKEEFKQDNNLLSYYIYLKAIHLSWIITLFFSIFKPFLHKNLLSKKPQMFYFDLYKMSIMNEIARKAT